MNVPADDDRRSCDPLEGRRQGVEVGLRVDEEAETLRAFELPTVAPWAEQRALPSPHLPCLVYLPHGGRPLAVQIAYLPSQALRIRMTVSIISTSQLLPPDLCFGR